MRPLWDASAQMGCFIALFRITYRICFPSTTNDVQNFCKHSNSAVFHFLLDLLVVNDLWFVNDIQPSIRGAYWTLIWDNRRNNERIYSPHAPEKWEGCGIIRETSPFTMVLLQTYPTAVRPNPFLSPFPKDSQALLLIITHILKSDLDEHVLSANDLRKRYAPTCVGAL